MRSCGRPGHVLSRGTWRLVGCGGSSQSDRGRRRLGGLLLERAVRMRQGRWGGRSCLFCCQGAQLVATSGQEACEVVIQGQGQLQQWRWRCWTARGCGETFEIRGSGEMAKEMEGRAARRWPDPQVLTLQLRCLHERLHVGPATLPDSWSPHRACVEHSCCCSLSQHEVAVHLLSGNQRVCFLKHSLSVFHKRRSVILCFRNVSRWIFFFCHCCLE